jgi:hypothetical protein
VLPVTRVQTTVVSSREVMSHPPSRRSATLGGPGEIELVTLGACSQIVLELRDVSFEVPVVGDSMTTATSWP